MIHIVGIALKGFFRDRIFQGIMALACLFLFIPSIASLSLRQTTELSITLSLSLISFIMLLLSIFLGATAIWRDIERRYTFSILSLPLSRSVYLSGRFFGVALFMLVTGVLLGSCAMISIKAASMITPPLRPLLWSAIAFSILFCTLKYILVAAIAMLLATASTSFFLPIFGAISTFMAGTATQQVYDYLQTTAAQANVPGPVRSAASFLYYLLPNLGSFDLKVNAIYAIPVNSQGIMLTVAYFILYVGIVLSIAAQIFSRREFV
jgi:ABC-type transport system involved in multi-copper enzyme maturation permease subunit